MILEDSDWLIQQFFSFTELIIIYQQFNIFERHLSLTVAGPGDRRKSVRNLHGGEVFKI